MLLLRREQSVSLRGGDKKGCYTMLDNPFRAVRRRLFPGFDEKDLDDEEEETSYGSAFGPDRPCPLSFDFVDVCGEVGAVSHDMALAGWVVAPVLDFQRVLTMT